MKAIDWNKIKSDTEAKQARFGKFSSADIACFALIEVIDNMFAARARIAQLEADVATMEVTEYEAERFAPEYKRQIEEPLETRITELVTAVREAQTQLRATSRNWDEDCLYRADDILTNALAAHPALEQVTP
jgi:hypothetical protein